MIFKHDYSSFLNLNDCPPEEFQTIKEDFTSNLVDLLRDMGCDAYLTDSIAQTVFSTMVHDRVYYHTPVHVLYLLSFAQENHIELENWEKLAIYFHDAIYRPGAKNNEENSAILMNALLDSSGIEAEELHKTTDAIKQTAKHLESNINPMFHNIMDLDLCGFAANPKPFNLQNQMIEMEFCQPKKKNYGCTLEKYLEGRMAFLTALKSKASMYYTDKFKNELNMEVKAQVNLDNQLKETQRRLDTINKKKVKV